MGDEDNCCYAEVRALEAWKLRRSLESHKHSEKTDGLDDSQGVRPRHYRGRGRSGLRGEDNCFCAGVRGFWVRWRRGCGEGKGVAANQFAVSGGLGDDGWSFDGRLVS